MNKSVYSTFPPILRNDTDFDSTAKAISVRLDENLSLSEYALVYSRINILPEIALDILAYDFNIRWYDYSFSIDEKRSIIKEAYKIFRFIGTRYAVEMALKSIYPISQVREWFEYGGKPYHFKVTIWDNANDKEKCKSVIQKINYYKNVRSILEETTYIVGIQSKARVYCGAITSGKKKSIYCRAKKFEVWQRSEALAKIHSGVQVTGKQTKKHILTAREV